MLIGTICFYHFTPLSLTLILVGGHKLSSRLCAKLSAKQNLHFLAHFLVDQDEIWSELETISSWRYWYYFWVRFYEIMEIQCVSAAPWFCQCSRYIYFAQMIFKGGNCWCVFIKCTFNIVLFWDTCQLMCAKLSIMLSLSKLNSLIPVWLTLMFTHGHRATWKLELEYSSCHRDAWSSSYAYDS